MIKVIILIKTPFKVSYTNQKGVRMKGFHLICAKCGSMDIWIEFVNSGDSEDDKFICTTCENCGELTDIKQHNAYMQECKENKRWYLS